MPKLATVSNYRVEVYPRHKGDCGVAVLGGYSWTPQEEKIICEKIEALIKKHVGKYDDNRGHTQVICDTENVCSHCGSRWTETSQTYNGGCCAKDEEMNPESNET
jgi:hypothetical protein